MGGFETALQAGLEQIIDYLTAHTWNSIFPAFFIAGAIAVFLSKDAVLKYFSSNTKPYISYSIASVSGVILAVCSCVIIPLFAGIRRRGAGIGPATTFLYSGPAINIMALALTARVLGYEIGLARAVMAITMSIAIGIIMSLIFRGEEQSKKELKLAEGGDGGTKWLTFLFVTMLVTLLIGTASIALEIKIPMMLVFTVLTGVIAFRWMDRGEVRLWGQETFSLFKMIFPLLLIGVFAAGMIRVLMPPEYIVEYLGSNSIISNLTASVIGAFMYFATLTEVPIVESLVSLGMHKGPELSLLLAGPALSLPNMLAIRQVLGTKKTLTYVSLVIMFATISGIAYGSL